MDISPFSIDSSNRKIDPYRNPEYALRSDGSPDDNDRVEICQTALAFAEREVLGLEIPHLDSMCEFHPQSLVQELPLKRGLALILCFC